MGQTEPKPLKVCDCMKVPNESKNIGLFVKEECVPPEYKSQTLAVPLQSLSYDVQIVQNVARVELKQQYRNLSSTFLEAEYFFPVRTNACISDFLAEFDGKVVRGIIKEKEEARKEYNERKVCGDLVAYSEVKEETPDIMKILIGNIPPQGEVKITFVFVQELEVSVNQFWKFRLPSTISSRYCNDHAPSPKATIFKSCWDRADKTVIESMPQSAQNLYTWRIHVTLNQNSPIQFVRSPSHGGQNQELNLHFSDQSHRSASFEVVGVPKKDFVLLFSSAEISIPKAVLGQAQDDKKLCALVSFVPDLANASNLDDAYRQQLQTQEYEVELDTAANEFIFILDRSGSMGGARIKQAKVALLIFLKSLPPGSYFNVVSFGSGYTQLFETSQPYEENIVRNAIEQVEHFNADMDGTQIDAPLHAVFNQAKRNNMPRQILLLTDGDVSNPQQVIQLVAKNRKLNRLHTIGIGSGVSEQLVKKCAQNGGGQSVFVDDGGDVQGTIVTLLQSILTPYLDQFSFQFDKSIVDSIVPNPDKMGPITKNQPFNMFVFFKDGVKDINTSLKFSCYDSKKSAQLDYEVKIQNKEGGQWANQEVLKNAIYRLGINRILKQIENDIYLGNESDVYFVKPNELNKTLVQLSVANQVLSTKTAFICVVEEAGDAKKQEVADKGQQKIIVPQLLSKDYASSFQYAGLKATSKNELQYEDSDEENKESYEQKIQQNQIFKCRQIEQDQIMIKQLQQQQQYMAPSPLPMHPLPSTISQVSSAYVYLSKDKDKQIVPESLSIEQIQEESQEKNKQSGHNIDLSSKKQIQPDLQEDDGGKDLFEQINKGNMLEQEAETKQIPTQTASEKNVNGKKIFIGNQALMKIISAQRLEGNWDSQSAISDQIGLNAEDIAAIRPENVPDGDVWITLLLVLILRIYFVSESKQWALIEKKALKWLEKNAVDIKKQQQLLPVVEALLS